MLYRKLKLKFRATMKVMFVNSFQPVVIVDHKTAWLTSIDYCMICSLDEYWIVGYVTGVCVCGGGGVKFVWVVISIRLQYTIESMHIVNWRLKVTFTFAHSWEDQDWDLENCIFSFPDSKVHGAHIGPIWDRQDPGGPHVGPMNFVIWVTIYITVPDTLMVSWMKNR